MVIGRMAILARLAGGDAGHDLEPILRVRPTGRDARRDGVAAGHQDLVIGSGVE